MTRVERLGMVADTVTVRRSASGSPWALAHEQARLVRLVLFVAAGLAASLACVLLARRWADALQRPLDVAGLAVLTMVLAGLAVGARLLWHAATSDVARWQVVFDATVSAAVLGLAAAVSLPQSPVPSMIVLWLVVLGGESAAWYLQLRRRGSPATVDESVRDQLNADLRPGDPSDPQHPLCASSNAFAEDDESSETLPVGVSQRMTRACEDGSEMVYGIIRCDFAPNLRQQNVHIAFCPPLHSRPQLSVDQVDGPTARIRSTVVETYGAGMEVKLKSASSEPTSVQIQFYAHEAQSHDVTV